MPLPRDIARHMIAVRRALHHPQFRVDEDALPLGAATLEAATLDFVRGRA